jgi:hypothetical protein
VGDIRSSRTTTSVSNATRYGYWLALDVNMPASHGVHVESKNIRGAGSAILAGGRPIKINSSLLDIFPAGIKAAPAEFVSPVGWAAPDGLHGGC